MFDDRTCGNGSRWVIVEHPCRGRFLLAWAQSTTPATSDAQTPSAPTPAEYRAADASQQKPDRVTTTVVVHGEVKDDYLSDAATAASLDNTTAEGDSAFCHRRHQRPDERPGLARSL